MLPLLWLLCQCGNPTKVEEITYLTSENSKNGMISDITSLFFITPEIGFSCMPIRKELGTYPLGTLFRQTTDGGKSWTTLSFFKDYESNNEAIGEIFDNWITDYVTKFEKKDLK